MEETKASAVPHELVELYNLHIHGEIDRRQFLDRAQRFAVGGVTAAMLWEMLKPNYALGQKVPENDARLKVEVATVPSPQGNGTIKGSLYRPAAAGATKLPGILVVHENRGLNPHIKDVARRIALENFMAFAPDGLTSVGGFPEGGDDSQGSQLFGRVDGPKMAEDFVAAATWLKARADCTGKIGVTGFCYGGAIANTLATRMPDLSAAVPYYGRMPTNPADIAKIKAAILVHHGATDAPLAAAWPAYDAALKAASVTYEGYVYPGAGHGFNNDATAARYNEAAAKLAWDRTIAWFNKYVRG